MPPQSQLPPTHYELLELSPEASPVELRQSFRSLSKRYHPDTTTLPAEQASEAFARLRQAYAVLADPLSRRAYDAELLRRRAAALPRPLAPSPVGPLPPRPTPIGVRRSLSGGEWFALVLLALALVLSLVLGVGLAWARGMALVTQPSWWLEAASAPDPAPPGSASRQPEGSLPGSGAENPAAHPLGPRPAAAGQARRALPPGAASAERQLPEAG